MMRSIAAMSVALILFVSAPASAQEWTEFVSREDGFTVDFPGQPKVQDTTFTSEYSYTLPARVYSVERSRERYLMTVVDYNGIEAMGQQRAKACPPGAEPCHGSMNTGEGYWTMDRGGAIVYATWKTTDFHRHLSPGEAVARGLRGLAEPEHGAEVLPGKGHGARVR